MPEETKEKETRNRTSANGEGSCRFIENKKLWCARITIGWESAENGQKQIRKAFYGKTKKEALDKATAAKARVMNGQAATSSDIKLSDWADKWTKAYCLNLSPRTVTGYKSVIENLIKPGIGDYRLKDLKPIHIQKMITDLVSKGLSRSHINRARVLTNDMLEAALDNDMLIKNPCRKVCLPPMPAHVLDRTPFTPEEETAIFDFAPQYLTQSLPHVQHRIGKMIIIMIRSGVRQEELLGLQWGDIDMKNDTIHVQRAVTIKDGAPIIKETKTPRSKRNIPMHRDIKSILQGMKQGKPEDYIFPTESGGLILPRNFQRDYKKFFTTAKKNGYIIKYRPPHVCRHTFASDLLAKGVDIKTISRLLGHTRIEITDIYAHTTDAAMKNAIDRL
jgi:site-specific recombinase XerD